MLDIFIATRFSRAVVIAGATMSVAVSSNCGRGCTVPVVGWPLLTVTDTWMIRVACAGMVCVQSVLTIMACTSSSRLLEPR